VTAPGPHEQVDLTPVQKAFEAALAALLTAWAAVKRGWVHQLRHRVSLLLATRDIRALASMPVDTTHAAGVVHDALTRFAKEAAQHAVDEAAVQGHALTPVVPADAEVADSAAVVATLLAGQLSASAGSEAVRVHSVAEPAATDVPALVEEHLVALSDAQPEYLLGASLTGVQHRARGLTLAKAAGATLYASEVMDTHTCEPCAAVDGAVLAVIDEHGVGDLSKLFALYPTRGYINCLGRDRCRGTVVAVWPREDEG